ncbi:MAG: hypothetical protein AB7K24_12315 [Gemmataceae bacterium]
MEKSKQDPASTAPLKLMGRHRQDLFVDLPVAVFFLAQDVQAAAQIVGPGCIVVDLRPFADVSWADEVAQDGPFKTSSSCNGVRLLVPDPLCVSFVTDSLSTDPQQVVEEYNRRLFADPKCVEELTKRVAGHRVVIPLPKGQASVVYRSCVDRLMAAIRLIGGYEVDVRCLG